MSNLCNSSPGEVEAVESSKHVHQLPATFDGPQSTAVGAIVAKFELKRTSSFSSNTPLIPPFSTPPTVINDGHPNPHITTSGKEGKSRSPRSLRMQLLVSSFSQSPQPNSRPSSSRTITSEIKNSDSTILQNKKCEHLDPTDDDITNAAMQLRGTKLEFEKKALLLQDEATNASLMVHVSLRGETDKAQSMLTIESTKGSYDTEGSELEIQRIKHDLMVLQLAYGEQMKISQIEKESLQSELKEAKREADISASEVTIVQERKDGICTSIIVSDAEQGDVTISERMELERLQELEKRVLSFILHFDDSNPCDLTIKHFLEGRGVEITRNRRLELETLRADNDKVNSEIAAMRQVLSVHERINGITLELCPDSPDKKAVSDFRRSRLASVPEHSPAENIDGGVICDEKSFGQCKSYDTGSRNACIF